MAKVKSSKTALISAKNVITFSAYLIVVWGFYRFLFQLPEEIEELVIKPIVWLVPLYFFLKKEKSGFASLGLTTKNLFPAIYLAVGLGLVFGIEAMIINYLKYAGFVFSANIGENFLFYSLFLSLATAITEEVAFRGYIFGRIWTITNSEALANGISSGVWTLVHLPIAVFVWKLNGMAVLTYSLLTLLFGIGSALIYARTRNLVSPIILHVLWIWPIILFR